MKFLKNLYSKLNFKLILIHFAAISFMAMGARQFNQLFNLDIIKAGHQFHIDQLGKEKKLTNNDRNILDSFSHHVSLKGYSSLMSRIAYMSFYKVIWYFCGALAAIAISLFIGYKKKIFWLNPVLAFILAIYLASVLFKIHWINIAVYSAGSLFGKIRYRYEVIFDGIFFIAIGLFLMFNGKIRNFISHQSNEQEEIEV